MSDTKPADSKPPPKKKKTDPAPGVTKTPSEWMKHLKRYTKPSRLSGARGLPPVPHWQHNAAAQLHGWKQHAHDAGEPIQLSQKDYEAALAAVERNPIEPHAPATSPHRKGR